MFDIVMSLYNKEKFVTATIKAVLAQTYEDWRLIVVDDGSADRGADVVAGYDDPRIRLIRQGNRGVGTARNAGIRAGSAEWIALLDADDVWNVDHLEELDGLRRDFPQAVLIGSGFTRFSGAITPPTLSGGSRERRLARYFAECARGRELFFTSSAAVRRTALGEVGEFEDLPGNEDVELWARLALHGAVAVSSKHTANYRVDTGGITEEGMGGHKPAPKPMRREELSSTIPMLDRALPGVADPVLRQDIVAYMDSRIGLRLVSAVLERDFDYARHLISLYKGKPRGKAWVAALIARLPKLLARSAVALSSLVKRRFLG